MTHTTSDSDHAKRFPIVGRDSRVDLAKYTVNVRGRDVIDYERLKAENPKLYQEIVSNEFEADRKHDEELRQASENSIELDAGSLLSAQIPQKPATAKYFYVPVFTSEPDKGSFESSILVFGGESTTHPLRYASRVMPGQTLKDAVAADLRNDFKYFGDFEILQHRFYDTTQDKHGNHFPRLLVQIATDRFATNDIEPVGARAHWVAGQAFLSSMGLLEWIPHIPFHKFFDPEKEQDFIDCFEALKSKELNYDDTQFILKNNKTNEFYVAIESGLGSNIDSPSDEALTIWLGTDKWTLEQIKPLYSDWFATHTLYHIKVDRPR